MSLLNLLDDDDDVGQDASPKEGADAEGNNSKNSAPAEAKFESLSDGSTALVERPGLRIKLDLNELLVGG